MRLVRAIGSEGRNALPVAAILLCTFPSASRAQSDERNLAYAQQHFERGVAEYRDGSFSSALNSFRASFAVHPSPNSSLYIARCLRGLEQWGEAVSTYEETVRIAQRRARDDARYRETVAASKQEARSLEQRVGRLVILADGSSPAARLTVGARTIPVAAIGLPIAVSPGTHLVSLSEPGGAVRQATVEVEPRVTSTITLVMPAGPARPNDSIHPAESARPDASETTEPRSETRGSAGSIPGGVLAGLISSGVVAVAGWSLFAIFGAMAASQFDDLREACGDGPCAPEFQDRVERGRDFELVANIGLVSGAIATVAAGLFLVWAVQSSPDPDERGVTLYPGGIRGNF